MSDIKSNVTDRPWLDASAEPFIRINNLSKKFGPFTAVDDVSLDIYRGELFALLGGSGCGKTTLLRMLGGFEHPSNGSITIDGIDMNGVPPYERPVNMMFQSYALFPHMSVRKNVEYGLKRDRVPKSEMTDRVDEMLKMVEMADFAKRKPHQLSGGQRQRVALARALVKKPKVLLLDEPLAALDKRLREQTQYELMNIQDELGITFIVVTHDQEEAMALATRLAVMKDGEFVQVGTPTQIYENPETRFIADFVGTANVFEGRVDSHVDGEVSFDTPALSDQLTVIYPGALTSGTKAWVAVRPEKIRMSRTGTPTAGANRVEGVVEDIGYFGGSSTYRVRIDGGTVVQVTQPNLNRPTTDRHVAEWEDRVFLEWDAASAVLLTK